MARIIEAAHEVCIKRTVREFDLREDSNSGFIFNVIDGEIEFRCEGAKSNFQYCLEHPEKYEDKGIINLTERYWQDAVAFCECGKNILLHDSHFGASQCNYCGRWHNLAGQELLQPNYWE